MPIPPSDTSISSISHIADTASAIGSFGRRGSDTPLKRLSEVNPCESQTTHTETEETVSVTGGAIVRWRR